MRRAFQAGDQQEATLELRRFGPGDGLQVVVMSSTLSRSSAEPRVRWEPD